MWSFMYTFHRNMHVRTLCAYPYIMNIPIISSIHTVCKNKSNEKIKNICGFFVWRVVYGFAIVVLSASFLLLPLLGLG